MRNESAIRQWRVFSILLDGRSHPVEAFVGVQEEFNVVDKTIRRDLEMFENIPSFQVVSFVKHSRKFWRCDATFVVTKGIPRTKRCSYCRDRKVTKDEFHKMASSPDGYKSICKVCEKQYNQEWRERNRGRYNKRMHAYYLKNRQRILEQQRERRQRAKHTREQD